MEESPVSKPLWARFFSFVLHPLILPSAGLYILFSLPTFIQFSVPQRAQSLLILIVLINTGIAPLLSIYFLYKTKVLSDTTLNNRRERIIPTFISVLFYIFTWFLFRQTNLPSMLNHFILGATLLTILGLLVTLWWKISIHMMSIGGMVGFLSAVSLTLELPIHWMVVIFIILSGILGSARVVLRSHNQSQVYAGFTAGFLVMFLTINLLHFSY